MEFTAFEHDRPFVIEALRRGELDYLENLSEAAEADFFRHPNRPGRAGPFGRNLSHAAQERRGSRIALYCQPD